MATPAQRKAAEQAERILLQDRLDPVAEAQRIMDAICERLANGESLRHVCSDRGFPTTTTIKRWLNDNETFRAQYARAREDQADHYADEIIEISDRAEDAAKARLRVDARKWVSSKLLPKKYGDKVTNELTGVDGKDLHLTDNDLSAKLAAILEAAAKRRDGV